VNEAQRHLQNKVAVVTGAAQGIGRRVAERLPEEGGRVAAVDRSELVHELRGLPGAADRVLTLTADLERNADAEGVMAQAVKRFGRIDILVNNAGILRDKSFSKMTLDDFRLVVDVHLMGSVYVTKAVWDIMKAQNYGRIIFTTSSSGLFGNFGQANYGAAKMAVVGLMQTLSLEGEKYNVRVNCLAPTAATRMTEDLMPPAVLALLTPESVSPGVVFVASEDAPTRAILCAGAGGFAASHITLTEGTVVPEGADAAEQVAARFAQIDDRHGEMVPASGAAQSQSQLAKVMAARSLG